jgi:phage repressor protein C with HTH and peptisase S24 domain
MKKPKFPNGLDEAMTTAGIGPTALGRKLGESKQNVDRWRKGERRLKPEDALRIAPLVNSTATKLLRLPDGRTKGVEKPERPIPLVSWISAGRLSGSEVPSNVRAERQLPRGDLGPGEWIALKVRGDSMNLVAPENSIIFVNIADKDLIEDRFYVFKTEQGDSTFKRYRGGKQPRLQPYSTNPDHETIPATEEILVVGRVRRTILDL